MAFEGLPSGLFHDAETATFYAESPGFSALLQTTICSMSEHMKNFVTSSMTDWTSFFRESIVFPPRYSDHKETLKYAQSTSICNAQSTFLQLNTEALKWEQEYSADRKA